MVVLAAWSYQYPCGMCQPHEDSEADMKSCGHSYSVQVCVPYRPSGLPHTTEHIEVVDDVDSFYSAEFL